MDGGAVSKPDDLTFWSFIERANATLRSTYGYEHQLATELALTLNRASTVMTYDFEAAVHRPRGWSWSSFRLLFVTWLAGPIEPARAAQVAGMSRAAVSNLSKSLVADGLLDRTPDDLDGRSARFSLTPHGHDAMVDVFAAQNERERAWAGALSEPEQHTLIALLNKLITDRSEIDVRTRR
ncbi:MarR family transcriptional regulator [Aeromicrobium sp. CFBP 8757]|uniref:MarR family winged helix-turn-helix transcriptional regulator n=1 Tax=Aeromicrobium sp. CFBP 8757 TaxID=2775288 RepID=UPI00177F268F|nr:MarR family transcriptional regulator [Aeromicrobium sp. CFBP 8757]MBD8605432.1 MarR family transcriptional regulator [Aeromicrobium sp. CFBP 8757]